MDLASYDHSPLSITLGGDDIKRHKTLKFFNCLANHSDFLSRIRIGWTGNGQYGTMKTVWQKLKKVKTELKQLNIREFQGLADKVKEIRRKLQELQVLMRDSEQVHSYSVL